MKITSIYDNTWYTYYRKKVLGYTRDRTSAASLVIRYLNVTLNSCSVNAHLINLADFGADSVMYKSGYINIILQMLCIITWQVSFWSSTIVYNE